MSIKKIFDPQVSTKPGRVTADQHNFKSSLIHEHFFSLLKIVSKRDYLIFCLLKICWKEKNLVKQ